MNAVGERKIAGYIGTTWAFNRCPKLTTPSPPACHELVGGKVVEPASLKV